MRAQIKIFSPFYHLTILPFYHLTILPYYHTTITFRQINKNHLDPGQFYMLHLLNYFLQSAVYYDQLRSACHVVHPDQLVGACYTLNILSWQFVLLKNSVFGYNQNVMKNQLYKMPKHVLDIYQLIQSDLSHTLPRTFSVLHE